MRKQALWILVLILLIPLLLPACGRAPEPPANGGTPDSPVKSSILIPPKMLSIAGQDTSGMCENYEHLAETYGLYCEAAAAGPDSVSITFLESERGAWKEAILASLNEMLEMAASGGDSPCRVDIADDYRSISSYIHREESPFNIAYYVLMPELDCAYLQLFSGEDPEEWYVEINIYNADTGKIVIRGSSNEAMTITDADWAQSE